MARPASTRGQRTRQKLLDAAEAVFGRKGYHEASISDITRRAGVAQGTFYVYFASKRAILAELVRERSRNLRRAIREATAGLADRLEIERVGFETFFRFIRRHEGIYRIVNQAEFVDRKLFRWYYRRLASGYARGLAEAMRRGQIGAFDPEVVAYCLMGIADFVGMRYVLWEPDGPPAHTMDQVMRFIRRALTGGPA
ncbi:MAG: TetR/AcrR family transcriptional regulator [Armatimonadota bacterium]|nr:TetR/AcrR family transcriptional regulator [Armatimonadota bacterium]MDR5696515.1 TetR/AcrR family transcriptional regulator [Armatimonadota bacterium]